MKNIRVFLSENYHFLEVKFSMYLNRRVFVMGASNNIVCCVLYTYVHVSLNWPLCVTVLLLVAPDGCIHSFFLSVFVVVFLT